MTQSISKGFFDDTGRVNEYDRSFVYTRRAVAEPSVSLSHSPEEDANMAELC